MKPNWVLSDEQCTIRFRKVRQEKINEVELDIEEEQDKKKMEGEVKVDEEEMRMTGSIMKREKSVSESTSREVGIVRT